MIKYNDNPMNNNFWRLFKQLISQLAQMHKKTDNTAVATWEYHFQKLQYGLPLDEDNPDVIDISKNENCNKKIIQNDAGPSQNKSNDKRKTLSGTWSRRSGMIGKVCSEGSLLISMS